MVKIKVEVKQSYTIELDIESFEEICFSKMSRDNSDELISDILIEKFGVAPDEIISVNEVRTLK